MYAGRGGAEILELDILLEFYITVHTRVDNDTNL